MVVTTYTCSLIGINAHLVGCEVDLANQLPQFQLVGLASSLTQESKERIRSAIINSQLEWPAKKVTINLLPASLPKWGSHFELAMALGILQAMMGNGSESTCENKSGSVIRPNIFFAVGELSLSGSIRPIGWLSSISQWLQQLALDYQRQGCNFYLLAHPDDLANCNEFISNTKHLIKVLAVTNLTEVLEKLAVLEKNLVDPQVVRLKTQVNLPSHCLNQLARVQNEPLGVIAALAAIANSNLHAMLVGPQGMGKSMLLKAVCEAAAPLNESQRFERSSLLKIFGESFDALEYHGPQPTVFLQTSISRAALEGAVLRNGQVLPGEMTRAHLGILVADEFLELRRDVIEAFRQPLEEGAIRLQRAQYRAVLPARFQLLASSNLCPCGNWGKDSNKCRCSSIKRNNYQLKLSGPIIDRFDLVVLVGAAQRQPSLAPDLKKLIEDLCNSKTWQQRLKEFKQNYSVVNQSSSLAAKLEKDFFIQHLDSQDFSQRTKIKILKLAQTLAALCLSSKLELEHFRLALLLRQNLEQTLLKSEPFSFSIKKSLQF